MPGNSAGLVGSFQSDAFLTHRHRANMEIGAEPITGSAAAQEAAGAHGRRGAMYVSDGLLQDTGGRETRPKNHGVLYMIFSGRPLSLDEATVLAGNCLAGVKEPEMPEGT